MWLSRRPKPKSKLGEHWCVSFFCFKNFESSRIWALTYAVLNKCWSHHNLPSRPRLRRQSAARMSLICECEGQFAAPWLHSVESYSRLAFIVAWRWKEEVDCAGRERAALLQAGSQMPHFKRLASKFQWCPAANMIKGSKNDLWISFCVYE